jgi:hypothetical protein
MNPLAPVESTGCEKRTRMASGARGEKRFGEPAVNKSGMVGLVKSTCPVMRLTRSQLPLRLMALESGVISDCTGADRRPLGALR